MNDVSKPPPSSGAVFVAAAAGGFAGAIGGAIVAANMMGDPNTDAKVQAPEAQEQVLVAGERK